MVRTTPAPSDEPLGSTCTKCGAPITWVESHTRRGRRIPIDAGTYRQGDDGWFKAGRHVIHRCKRKAPK